MQGKLDWQTNEMFSALSEVHSGYGKLLGNFHFNYVMNYMDESLTVFACDVMSLFSICEYITSCVVVHTSLGVFLCIQTPNTDQLNLQFHTLAEFRPVVNRVVARQFTDWLAANAQFSANVVLLIHKSL